MRWILLGALLGVLLLFCPAVFAVLAAFAAALLSKPLVIAFTAGVVSRPLLLKRLDRWAA